MSGRFIDFLRNLTAKSTTIDGSEQVLVDSSGLPQKATLANAVSYTAPVLAQDWSSSGRGAGGATVTGIKFNATGTDATSASSLLIDLQVGGSSKFKVTKAGVAYITLPTSNPGAGILWNDGGVIKVGT